MVVCMYAKVGGGSRGESDREIGVYYYHYVYCILEDLESLGWNGDIMPCHAIWLSPILGRERNES